MKIILAESTVDRELKMVYTITCKYIEFQAGEYMKTIAFPKLDLSFTLDPILVHYGNGGIHWYGVIIAAGVLLALLMCSRLYKGRGRDPEELVDFLLWALPIGIVGARLYYVIFSWEDYAGRPMAVFEIWNGGLAIYGGIIAGLITALVFCRIKGLSFPEFADICMPGVALGQCLGRWGNFVNGEAHGGETALPWGMSIDGAAPVHPTFLYESLWSLAGMIILIIIVKKCLTPGSGFFAYLIWYGAGRFFIEGLRTDSLYLVPGLRVSQLVAVISVAVGAAGFTGLIIRKKKGQNC